jgi:hypothetical protein
MIQFAFLGKSKSQEPEFQKEYLKVVGEEPTPAVPDQMEKLVRELPRATEIVALSERVSEKGMIARPAPPNCPLVFQDTSNATALPK